MGGITSSHDGMAATERKRFVKKVVKSQIEELWEKIQMGPDFIWQRELRFLKVLF